MRKRSLAYVKTVRARGHVYHYFDTGERRDGKPVYKRLPDKSDPSFGRVYAAMLGHRTRRDKGGRTLTVTALVEKYQASRKFQGLAGATQKAYRIYQARLVEMLPTAPAGAIERSDILALFERMGSTPGAANLMLKSVAALYKWARQAELVKNRPTDEIDPNEIGEHQPWPPELVNAALADDDDLIRLAAHLLYYTAQRIGDVAAMRWSAIDGGFVSVVQQKTSKPLHIAIHPALARTLGERHRDLRTILSDAKGRPFSVPRLRGILQKWAADQGYKVVPHGLRKNAVISLLECGCTTVQVAAVSGQSLAMVEHYAKQRNQKKLSSAAMEAWAGTESESSNIRKTGPENGT